ncbi:alpha-L-arabinofuranosidase C-terminal domain-containing protein [Lachnoclostridium sp. Marseille-P6806]|uniref:alpha-L-arabinofuranosidase C-terminal domain-containing protein n=1 Tax=Lachnoclostridium sp. Marseille-P6806 TaxID=2364793 RepID=UPI001030255B|nr:alpha-L-arabinofuranosidase C-terminal domain-containing protein [Lachnoclostridium sp. Marseille-P6806]
MSIKAKISVHPAYVTGQVSDWLYGSFVEPIGTIVNGMMYNPGHPTADEHGFRRDVIDSLREAGVPAVRTPGGNFVSGWDWKSSIGPRAERKQVLDLAWKQYYSNRMGLDEYLLWAELIGAKPMLTINLGTGTIRDAIDEIEYTNHPGNTYWSDLRRKNGHNRPYGVKTWYLGNEMDGPWQIGSWEKDPKGYGVLANEVSKALKWVDPTIETAACVSSSPFLPHYPEWDEKVLEQCYESIDLISMHHYHSAEPGDTKGLLGGAVYFEDYINTEIALCDLIRTKLRSTKTMMLSFDEYGSMVRPFEPIHYGSYPHSLYAAHYHVDPETRYVEHDPDNMDATLRSRPMADDMTEALAMASVQLALLRHADRVKIGCMTGGLAALCANDRNHVWHSASYYVFSDMLTYGHGESMQVKTDCECFDIPAAAIDDNQQYAGHKDLPYIDSAVTMDEEKGELVLFLINRSEKELCDLTVDLRGFDSLQLVEQREMTGEKGVKNTFESPNRIRPVITADGRLESGYLKTVLRPYSWNMIRLAVQEKDGRH